MTVSFHLSGTTWKSQESSSVFVSDSFLIRADYECMWKEHLSSVKGIRKEYFFVKIVNKRIGGGALGRSLPV